jgi:hypothetical protein
MEDPPKTTQSIGQSDVSQLRYQATAPDVPKDVDDEVMAHFNDPNWDFETNSSTLSISTGGVEHRRQSSSFNSKDACTEADTEFQVSSWRVHDLKADYSSEAIKWVLLSHSFYRISLLTLFHQ